MPELITIAQYAERCGITVAGAYKRLKAFPEEEQSKYITEINRTKYVNIDALKAAGEAIPELPKRDELELEISQLKSVINQYKTVEAQHAAEMAGVLNQIEQLKADKTELKQRIEDLRAEYSAEVARLRDEMERQDARHAEELEAMERDKQRLYAALDAEQHLHAATQAQLFRMLPAPAPDPETGTAPENGMEQNQRQPEPDRRKWWRRK